jgi:hypothetical protein
MKRIILLMILCLGTGMGWSLAWAQQSGGSGAGLQNTLEYNKTNQATKWVDPDTGKTSMITPTRTFENAQGQPCREFVENIFIAGKEQQGYGTACRQPDGTWRIVGGNPSASGRVSASSPAVVPAPQETVRTYYVYPYPYPDGYWWGYAGSPYYWGAYYAPYNFVFGFSYSLWPRHGFYWPRYRGGRHFHGHWRHGRRGFGRHRR